MAKVEANAAPGVPSSQPQKAPSYPVCIFAVGAEAPEARIRKEFEDEGLEILFVKTQDELYDALKKPEAFLLFIHISFCGNGVRIVRARSPESKPFVVFMAGRLSAQQSSSLFALGAADILSHPVHPVMYKSRARMMLARFLKVHDLPEEVVLPRGVSRRSVAAQTSAIDNSGSGTEAAASRVSNWKEEKEAVQHVTGGNYDEPTSAPYSSSSSSSRSGDSGFKIVTGGDEAPDWNHHQSENAPAAAWNHHASTESAQTAQTANPSFTQDEAAAWRHRNTKDLVSEARRGRATPLSEGVPQSLRREHLTSAQLFGQIAPELAVITNALSEIRTDVAWQKKNWPLGALPSPYRLGSSAKFRTFSEIVSELQNFFKHCCQAMGARRMLLLSVQPTVEELYEDWSYPKRLFLIGSSDDSQPLHDSEESALFPQVRVACEKQKPLYLAAPLPELFQARPRAQSPWKLGSSNEASSAVFPILSAGRHVGVLYVQFSRPCDDQTRQLLEEAVSFFQIPQKDYDLVDFLSRMYRHRPAS